MKISKARYLTEEETNLMITAAAQIACGGDFDFFKYLIERQDKAADAQEDPKETLECMDDVPAAALNIGKRMIEEKIDSKQAKEMTDVLKNVSELNIAADLKVMKDSELQSQ